jgi:addiction module HigA family antidote
MTEFQVRRPLKRPPTHPGELMRETIVDHLRLSKSEAARRMKISRATLYAMLTGASAVTADMAVRFAAIGGGEPQLLLNMQAAHDLWHAQQRPENRVASWRRGRTPRDCRPLKGHAIGWRKRIRKNNHTRNARFAGVALRAWPRYCRSCFVFAL